MTNRPPPADTEAELAYIANALVVPGYLDEHPCAPRDFFDHATRNVLEAMVEIHARGVRLDSATVMAELRGRKTTGDESARLADALTLPIESDGEFERHIRDCARRRRVIDLARTLLVEAYDRTEDIDRLVSGACVDLESTGADEDRDGSVVSLREMLAGSERRAAQRAREGAPTSVPLSLGHWQLDRDTGGLRAGKVAIVGAQSHWGKSSYALMVADLAITAGKRVLIVSAEDDCDTYADRWLQYRADIPKARFESGLLTPGNLDKIADAAQGAPDIPVFLDAIGRTPEWTVRQVRSLIRSEQIDLVMFDYLGAWVNEKTSGDDQRLRLNYVARLFTTVIKTTKVAGLMFSQITPGDNKGMYSLRDSKDIANAAEVILLGFKDDKGPNEDQRVIKLVKNKPGPAKAGAIYEMGTNPAVQSFRPVINQNSDWDWGALDYPGAT